MCLRMWPRTPRAFLEISRQAGHIFAREKDSPTLYEQRVGSLMSHVEILNMEGIVRRGLMVYIVLIREALKV